MPKHVIFLGAGASKTSTYPLADSLRKDWLASENALRQRIFEILDHRKITGPERSSLVLQYERWVYQFQDSLTLFRHGCFGTIDEYCRLIRKSRPADVVELKKMLRFVLSLQNPEWSFTKSDYYSFIQRLFVGDLPNLRDDVAVISFNYDVYLEWLLRRAHLTRRNAVNAGPKDGGKIEPAIDAQLTSGFSGDSASPDAIRDGNGFCLLKLHGMIAWPTTFPKDHPHATSELSFDQVFEPDFLQRVNTLLSPPVHKSDPPIVFPWEIMQDKGGFISERDFLPRDSHSDVGYKHGARSPNGPSLYGIFKESWIRAQREVREAKKISFIGLSMHDYLNQGFGFLFQPLQHLTSPKPREITLVITDGGAGIESGKYAMIENVSNPTPDHCPAARLLRLLRKYCPGVVFNRSVTGNRSARIRTSFADFIEKEMEAPDPMPEGQIFE